MKKKNNYIIAGAIGLGIILITIYIFKWYNVFNQEKIQESYLITSKVINNEITSLEELSVVLTESSSEYFLYISYTNDKNVYDMEVDLKKIIKKYNLEDKFYYFNVDAIKNDENYIDDINNVLGLEDEKISSIPTILYFKDQQLVSGGIIHSEENSYMQASDLEKMIDTLQIEI